MKYHSSEKPAMYFSIAQDHDTSSQGFGSLRTIGEELCPTYYTAYHFTEINMRIMVCYDDSHAAQEALKFAIKHAKRFTAKIYLVTSRIGGKELDAADQKKAESGLEYGKRIVEKENLECETHLLIRGMAAGKDLTQFADENKMDEIIIGIQKTSKVGKLLFGSTAQYVILEAECPVVTVK